MATTNETGHAKNLESFETLITYCMGYQGDYRPSNPKLEIKAMQALHAQCKESISNLNKILPAYSKAIENREIAFEPLSKLSTKIINALIASKVTSQSVENAKTHVSKLKGSRRVKKTEKSVDPNNPNARVESNSISTSQLSYTSRVNNLEKLIETLQAEPKYAPNEPELQIGTLQNLLAQLVNLNSAVIQASEPVSNARIQRDQLMYDDNDGLVQIALDVKSYVKSIYGTSSPKYKQISSLSFKRYRRE
jgi:phage terminase small subunit